MSQSAISSENCLRVDGGKFVRPNATLQGIFTEGQPTNMDQTPSGGWPKVLNYYGCRRDFIWKFEFGSGGADLGLRLLSHYFDTKFSSISAFLGGISCPASYEPQKNCANCENAVKQYEQEVEPEREPHFRRLVLAVLSVLGCFYFTFLGAKDINNKRRVRGTARVLVGILPVLCDLGLAVLSAFRWSSDWLL